MTNEELDALVQELLGKQVCTGFEQNEPYTIDCVYGPDPVCQHAATAITTLRAQLAEARAERDVWEIDAKRNHQAAEIEFARADRAEAALAAQIEVDAGIITSRRAEMDAVGDALPSAVDRAVFREIVSLLTVVATAIRNQPHDRTALDRVVAESLAAQQEGFIDVMAYAAKEARNRALLDAVDACRLYDAWGECRKAILALRGNYKPETSSQMDPPTKETDG